MTSSAQPRSGRHPERAAGAQVFARDRRLPDGAPLTYLERGGADRLRPDTRAGHLLCPLAECDDPRLSVRAGSRRDHFAHRPGAGGHGPETLAHHTAKQLIAAWLRHLYPQAALDVDSADIETGQRPDVLATFPDGYQVAYEVQFAHLTREQWQHRHDGYVSANVKDVWLFGGRRYDRDPRGAHPPGARAVHTVFDAVLAARHPMLLISPFTEAVAAPAGGYVAHQLAVRDPAPRTRAGAFALLDTWHPLGDVPATRGVIDIPGMRAELAAADAMRAGLLSEAQQRAAPRPAPASGVERATVPGIGAGLDTPIPSDREFRERARQIRQRTEQGRGPGTRAARGSRQPPLGERMGERPA